ncbi:MAG: polysaccharide biosynthesis tyrosine autokinase [Pirellulaceae bacterium]|nr:polysaccharide biosynthesis tyrosine autokinase [Pirellulaceae bacterium]
MAKIDKEEKEADSESETDAQEDGMDSSGEKTDADTRGKETGDPTPSAAPAASPEKEKANPPKRASEVIPGISPTDAIIGGEIPSKSEAADGDSKSKASEPELVASEDKSDEMDDKKLPDDGSSEEHLYLLKSITELLSEDTTPTDYVIKNLYVTTGGSGRARNARVLNIAFRHTSEEDCQTITRAIVNRYQEFVKSKFKDINTDAHTLIEKAKKDLEKEISDLEAEYKKFRDRAPLLSRGATGTDIYTTRYEELAAEFSQLAIQRDEAAGRLEMVKTSLTDFNKSGAHSLQKLALIDQGNAERLGILVTVERGKAETAAFQSTQPERMAGATAEYSQLLTLKTRLSQLTADFGPEYPEVKALRQQIGEMEGFLSKKQKELFIGEDVQLTPDDVMKAYVSMLDHDLRALDQRSQDIDKQMQIAEQKAKALVTEQLEDESLIRARERKEELYDAVVQRLRDLNLKKDQTPLILELIQEPTYPEKVEPKGVIAAAISALCALLVGGAGVLVAELKDRSVHSPEEFEEMLGSRVLAHLPNFQNDAEIRKLQRVARKQKSPLSPSLLTFYAPDSRASETFRALRTQVMFSAGGDHKILATTSSNQGAGKSMLSSNMAISMAGLGSNVLLIDCDMRLPQVHRLFGVSNEKGLADAIAHPEMVDSLVVPSGVPNLTLLPSGQSPANPAELLSRPECKELLESLRQKYAYIILDCPPVLAVSDPSILAPMADGVLFVSVVDSESRPKTLRAKRILEGVNAKIIGIVVNRSDESSQRYGYQAYGYESTGATDSYYAARPVR